MPTIDVVNTAKETVGSVELPDDIFGVEVKEHLFYTVVRYQLANRRAGTHKVKSRCEVSGGGRKPFKQKGTGRARQGTIRAPQMRGGGIVHGPTPRDHGFKVSKKVRRAALCSALSRRVQESKLTVFNAFELSAVKTKEFRKVMDSFGFDDLLLILPEKDNAVYLSARNLPDVQVLPVAGLNVYDVLKHKNIAVTSAAVDSIVSRLGR
ncbi:50S ribosomal protein L4 [Myxococcota bacterium]|jgi:large subunit ribosomal protein L4|nr:50S ribosomal protein L4 [Myxococcota bacterium]